MKEQELFATALAAQAASPAEDDKMWKISELIADLQAVLDQFGNTCVYVRRGGLSWGAVAINWKADDEKHGVFDLQAQHDRDMLERLEQIERLKKNRDEWRQKVRTDTSPAAQPVVWRETEMVRLIDLLRADEGDSVEILCDNPDFNGQPNCAIVCCGDWTGWLHKRFAADTVLDALSMAITEKNLPSPRKVIATSNGHHWIQRFNLVCCRDCGFVRRADDQNAPCKGPVGVGIRQDLATPAPQAVREGLDPATIDGYPLPWKITDKEGGQRAGHYGYAIEILAVNDAVVARIPKPYANEKAALIVEAIRALAAVPRTDQPSTENKG